MDMSFGESMSFDKWYCLNTVIQGCSKNIQKSCLFTGVSPAARKKFRAIGYRDKEQFYIGMYDTEFEAWVAYDRFQNGK